MSPSKSVQISSVSYKSMDIFSFVPFEHGSSVQYASVLYGVNVASSTACTYMYSFMQFLIWFDFLNVVQVYGLQNRMYFCIDCLGRLVGLYHATLGAIIGGSR